MATFQLHWNKVFLTDILAIAANMSDLLTLEIYRALVCAQTREHSLFRFLDFFVGHVIGGK